MENKDLLFKVSHNKILLFILPNLIYASKLLYYYNSNFADMLEVLFSEVIVLFLIFFVLTTLLYFFLKKAVKNVQKIFCIMCFICMFYFFKFTLIQFLLFIVFVLLLIIDFKWLIKFKLDNVIGIIIFIIIFLFSYNFFISISNVLYMITNSKSYDNDITIKVDDDTETPNIYYIHCDGMMGIDAMKKYFYYNDTYLTDYFKDNNYYLNEDASMVVGHKTQKALVAMFNPKYYDNFFKKYLLELEDSYINKSEKTSFVVDYYELEDKRLNNELFVALNEKNYTTIGIGEFNPYTSFYTDYFYDYYYYGDGLRYIDTDNNEFRSLNNNSKLKLLSYIRYVHLKPLISGTIFYDLLGNINFLNYDTVDYKSFNSSEYNYTEDAMNNSNYWVSKAILKGLDETMNIDNRKFTFVDFRLNHVPFTFDYYGNVIDEFNEYSPNYYLGNYIYSTYLLVDMLKFIKNNDEDAVIIVQGDHGIHTVDDEDMLKYFSTDMEGVQEIRNSVISAIYIPDKYKNGDEEYLDNPFNISRYIVNNYVGNNYEYLK